MRYYTCSLWLVALAYWTSVAALKVTPIFNVTLNIAAPLEPIDIYGGFLVGE